MYELYFGFLAQPSQTVHQPYIEHNGLFLLTYAVFTGIHVIVCRSIDDHRRVQICYFRLQTIQIRQITVCSCPGVQFTGTMYL